VRALAIDFGERRIGLAISDPTGTLAQPLPHILRRRGKRPPFRALLELIESHDVDRIVVGLPLSLEGTDTPWTTEVRDFAARLAARSQRDVFLADERLTSVMAERAVRALGLPRERRQQKERVDTASAILILQSFLDRQRQGTPVERVVPAGSDVADE
jgi:putative Holliday junction resolvase